ncbi:MAG: keratin [Candidatus Sumerlaeaceae bacterium]|nr:keratin [Candidatus Sumerlaeaceae bacterium]
MATRVKGNVTATSESDVSLSFLDVFACTTGILIVILILVAMLARSEIPEELEKCLKEVKENLRTVERMEREVTEQKSKLEAALWVERHSGELVQKNAMLENLKAQMQAYTQSMARQEAATAAGVARRLQESVRYAKGSVIRDTSADVAGLIVLLDNRRVRVVRGSYIMESDDYEVEYGWDGIYLVPKGSGRSFENVLQGVIYDRLFNRSAGRQINVVIGKTASKDIMVNFKLLRQALLQKGWIVGFVVLDGEDNTLVLGQGERVVVQ